ncbi:MAG: S1 RNA-binding domain-containing protein, partial [Calditrichaeota bacterium]
GSKLSDDEYAIGKTIKGWIRSLDLKNRRVGLTLHEMPDDDPWKNIGDTFQIDNVIEGIIEESTQYGVFVELKPGLTGLMPLSELKKLGFKNVDTEFKNQATITVKITAIDENRQRISLLPNEIPEHIVPETNKPVKKKTRNKRKEKPAESQNGNDQNGGVTAFGELLAAALNSSDDE